MTFPRVACDTPCADTALLVAAVCAALCDYYKPGKIEPERCGGYRWLAEALAACRLAPDWGAALKEPSGAALEHDRALGEAVCAACPFRAADCDYRDPAPPAGATPCGGLRALDRLLARRVVSEIDLSRWWAP